MACASSLDIHLLCVGYSYTQQLSVGVLHPSVEMLNPFAEAQHPFVEVLHLFFAAQC